MNISEENINTLKDFREALVSASALAVKVYVEEKDQDDSLWARLDKVNSLLNTFNAVDNMIQRFESTDWQRIEKEEK